MNKQSCKKIVVVNDTPSQLLIIKQAVQKYGCEVHSFESVETALKGMESLGKVDLIITDLYMPEIDGWTFCRLLRTPEYKNYNDTPIIVISATYSGAEVKQICLELGANAYLPMPFSTQDLYNCIDNLISGKEHEENVSVLIVEDSISQLTMLSHLFQKRGYLTLTAPTTKLAIKVFCEHQPNLAIIDYHLPDGKGDELLTSLKKIHPNLITIVVTADRNPKLALKLLRMGNNAYVEKPYDPSYLAELCQKLLREHALMRVDELLSERTKQLAKAENNLRQIFQIVHDMVIVHSAQGGIEFINDTAAQSLGYSTPDLLLGKNIKNLIAPQDIDGYYNHLEQCRKHKFANYNTCFQKQDGNNFAANVNASFLEENARQSFVTISKQA